MPDLPTGRQSGTTHSTGTTEPRARGTRQRGSLIMSGPLKKALIAGLVGGVIFAVIDIVVGARGAGSIVGASLVVFAIVMLIAYIIARATSGRAADDDYEYEDD